MYHLGYSFAFDAGHHLTEPYSGPCCNPHGHTFGVELTFRSEVLDNCGMIFDANKVAAIEKAIKEQVDHKDINEVIPQPTCENIARWIFEQVANICPFVVSVKVSEGVGIWGSYSR